MKTKIHNLPEYTPAQQEAFRQRTADLQARQREYDEPMAGTYLLGGIFSALIALAVMAVVLYFSLGWWQASDRLVGLGS